MTEAQIREMIRSMSFSSEGNSGSTGKPYHEIFFPEFQDIVPARAHSAKRSEAMLNAFQVQNKLVLDIGCNAGYFSFAFQNAGAKVVGVDHDRDSIELALALKAFYQLDRADFILGAFDAHFVHEFIARYGTPDVILLNSVIHWLLFAHGTLNDVANLLDPLFDADKEQHIIYEPSSTGVAYYPWLLETSGISQVFAAFTVKDFIKLGDFSADNASQTRTVFLGKRNIPKLKQEVEAHLSKKEIRTRKHKQVCHFHNFLIKSNEPNASASGWLLENEAQLVKTFKSSFAPQLVLHWKKDKRSILLYRLINGNTLSSQLVSKSDAKTIFQMLLILLRELSQHNICHNDVRPENLLWDVSEKQLTLIDFEFASRPEKSFKQYFEAPLSDQAGKTFIEEQLHQLGGEWRSPRGPGSFENDRYSINRIGFRLNDRKAYYRHYFKSRVMRLLTHVYRGSGLKKVFGEIP